MKHRILSFILAMAMVCAMCASALAAGGGMAIIGGGSGAVSIFSSSNSGNDYFYVDYMVTVGDTLYALADTNGGRRLAVWRGDMEEPLLLGQGKDENTSALINSSWYSTPEELEGVEGDTAHAIGTIFSDGERLLGINTLTGLVFEINVDGESLSYADVLTLKDTKPFFHQEDGENAYGVSMKSCAVANGVLYFTTNDWGEDGYSIDKLYAADLTSGEVSAKALEHVQRVASYKDGKLLAVIHDQRNAWDDNTQTYKNPDLAVYDPATDTAEIKAEMSSSNLDGLDYCAALDAVIFTDRSRIMGMKDFAEPRQYGYAPMTYVSQLVVLGESVVLSDYNNTQIRPLDENFKTDEYLTVGGGAWMDDGARLFASRNPNVPIYFSDVYGNDVETLSQAMVSGEDSVDVILQNISYSSFETLMEKGYCADLSGYPELVAAVNRMHPAIRDTVMKDGKLYAIPTDMNGWGWFYSPRVLEAVGLTEEDIPTNFVDLCDLVTRWNDEMLDEYPNYSLFDYVSDTKMQLFYWMMDAYLDWCTAQGRDVTFDTPEFRAMMTALEGVYCEDMDRVFEDEMSSDMYREGLLVSGYQTVGDFDWMSGDSEWQRFVPMTLTADTEHAFGVDLNVMFINPRSAHMDSAVQLLLCQLEALDDTRKHVMFTDETEPVPDPYFEERMKNAQESLAAAKEALEKADESEKKDLQEYVERMEQYAKDTENRRYSISQQQIDYYQQNVVPKLFVKRPTFFSGTQDNSSKELSELMSRFREGQIGLDQFIHEADNKLRMMRLENE